MVRVHLVPFPVAIRFGATPVPIPNTMVKTEAADNTVLATVWKDRRLPEFILRERRTSVRKSLRVPNGGIAQLGEHLLCKQGVKGSNPFISTLVLRRTSASFRKDDARRACSSGRRIYEKTRYSTNTVSERQASRSSRGKREKERKFLRADTIERSSCTLTTAY